MRDWLTVTVLLGLGACQPPPEYAARANSDLRFRNIGALPTGEHPNALVSLDVDGDGDLDLAVPGLVTPEIALVHNEGHGRTRMSHHEPGPIGALDAIAADLDGDGLDEIVTVVREDNRLVVLAMPDLVAVSTFEIAEPWYAAAGDLDGDGQLELAISRFSARDVVLLDVGPGLSFTEISRIPMEGKPTAMTVCDVTGDGRNELVVAESGSGHMRVLQGSGAEWRDLDRVVVGGWPSSLLCVDLDHDGSVEILGASNLGDTLFIAELGGGLEPRLVVESIAAGWGAFGVAAADLDQDGDPDVIVTNKFDDTLSVFRNNGGTLEPAGQLATGRGPTPVHTLHLDDDGNLDVAVVNAFDNTVELLLADP